MCSQPPPKALQCLVLLPQRQVRLHTQHNATQKQDRTKTLISGPPPQRSRRSRWVRSKVQSQNALRHDSMGNYVLHADMNRKYNGKLLYTNVVTRPYIAAPYKKLII